MSRYSDYSEFIEAYKEVAQISEISVEDAANLNSSFRKHLRYGKRAAQWPEHLVSEQRVLSGSLLPYTETGKQDIDVVWDIYTTDPLGTVAPRPLKKTLTSSGIVVAGYGTATSLYVNYLPDGPEFKGAEYSAATAYTVGSVVYYNTDSNYYKCILNSTGNAPTNATYWEKIKFSRSLLEFLAHACFSDYIRTSDENKANSHYALAMRWLGGEQYMLLQAQGQSPENNIKTANSQSNRR